MSEQKFWLVSLTGIVLLLGMSYWVLTHRHAETGPTVLTAEQVAALIEEATLPLQEKVADQAAQLESLAGVQQQLASLVEESDLRTALEQEIAQNAQQTRASLRSDLEKYESRLDDLQAKADDPAVANEIAATRAEIARIEVLLDDLSDRVDCASLAARTSVRTLVVPSRSSLEVPEETIVLSVGRLRNNVIDTVSINARAASDEPISTRVVGEVSIGSSVEFRHESSNFVATFTHATRRFLNSALINVELRASPAELAECR